MADAIQYQKVKKIDEADPTRRVVVVSAAGNIGYYLVKRRLT